MLTLELGDSLEDRQKSGCKCSKVGFERILKWSATQLSQKWSILQEENVSFLDNKENRGRVNSLKNVSVGNSTKNGLGLLDWTFRASPAVESFVNSSEMLENQENNKSKSDKGYHAVPSPYTGNFIPFKHDLTNVKKVESNYESAYVKNNGVAVKPKTVRKNGFRPPVIED
ncbi:hypothetical protein Tco_0464737 [Tanacetum coccineum]